MRKFVPREVIENFTKRWLFDYVRNEFWDLSIPIFYPWVQNRGTLTIAMVETPECVYIRPYHRGTIRNVSEEYIKTHPIIKVYEDKISINLDDSAAQFSDVVEYVTDFQKIARAYREYAFLEEE